MLSIDVAGSTTMSAEHFVELISLTLHELARVVPHFHGMMLKYTGDGMIVYFPPESFILANDHAVDCAVTFRKIVDKVINPILGDRSLPPIEVRIGIESGEAAEFTIGHPESKQH